MGNHGSILLGFTSIPLLPVDPMDPLETLKAIFFSFTQLAMVTILQSKTFIPRSFPERGPSATAHERTLLIILLPDFGQLHSDPSHSHDFGYPSIASPVKGHHIVVVPLRGANSKDSTGHAVPLITKGTSPEGVTSPSDAGHPPARGQFPRRMLLSLRHWALKALLVRDLT